MDRPHPPPRPASPPGAGPRAQREDPAAYGASAIFAGVTAGLLAGAAMLAVLVLAAALSGEATAVPAVARTGWTPLNAITAWIFGLENFGSDYRMASVAGVIIHFALAAGLGVAGIALIAVVLGRSPALFPSAIAGVAYGLALELLLLNGLVNVVRDPNFVYTSVPPWTWWLGHALYGGVLGLLGAAMLRRASEIIDAPR